MRNRRQNNFFSDLFVSFGFLIMEKLISVIIPMYNCQDFIQESLGSVLAQDFGDFESQLKLEISIYDDGSSDSSLQIAQRFLEERKRDDISVVMSRNGSGAPKGVGYARNEAIKQSSGEYLCFFDADDIMKPERILKQYLLAAQNPSALIGCNFKRIPENSTPNFTAWANNLTTKDQLSSQIYLSFGPSLVMPTWFCHVSVYDAISGGFDQGGKGTPEDLIFFYKHLDQGGTLAKIPQVLLTYRYHPNATTFSVKDETIWKLRMSRLELQVLKKWPHFSIWNAGKSGRKFYRALSDSSRAKVTSFCDVDEKKLNKKFFEAYPLKEKVPIVTPKNATPPFVICVKTELIWDANGSFRTLLDSLRLTEGEDYFYFN